MTDTEQALISVQLELEKTRQILAMKSQAYNALEESYTRLADEYLALTVKIEKIEAILK